MCNVKPIDNFQNEVVRTMGKKSFRSVPSVAYDDGCELQAQKIVLPCNN